MNAGATSQLKTIFIADSSSSVGAGLTGLTFESSGLTCYYSRDDESSMTAISLVTMTAGTWASGGFIEVDSTNAPGMYQVGIPNAVIATGVNTASMFFRGATNMVPVPLVFDLQVPKVNVTQTSKTATQITSAIIDGNVETYRGTRWTILVTGMGDLTGYQNLVYTAKSRREHTDSQAMARVDDTTGLLIANGAPATAGDGSITITDTVNGDATIIVDDLDIEEFTGFYDIKGRDSSSKTHLLDYGTHLNTIDTGKDVP